MNIGASQANINILKGEDSIFTRDITTIGGNQFTDAVVKDLNVTFEQAENLKQGQGVEGQSPEAVAPILSSVSESVLLEVQKTFDFFKATTSEDHIDRIVLSVVAPGSPAWRTPWESGSTAVWRSPILFKTSTTAPKTSTGISSKKWAPPAPSPWDWLSEKAGDR